MIERARVHLIQIGLSGSEIMLHGTCVLEADHKGSPVNVGNCKIEIKITAADAKPLVDKVKAELARLAADPKGPEEAKQFAGVPMV